jgi:hypothetical protein
VRSDSGAPACSWLETEQEDGKENIGRGEVGWAEAPFSVFAIAFLVFFFLGSLRLLWGFSGFLWASLGFLWGFSGVSSLFFWVILAIENYRKPREKPLKTHRKIQRNPREEKPTAPTHN